MDKVYIIKNGVQEAILLQKLQKQGVEWLTGAHAIEIVPSMNKDFKGFPYSIVHRESEGLSLLFENIHKYDDELKVIDPNLIVNELQYQEIVKYVARLEGNSWYFNNGITAPDVVGDWVDSGETQFDINERIIAIHNLINENDTFYVERNKWIVRSKKRDGVNMSFYVNVSPDRTWFGTTVEKGLATQFDTKEEADKYVNILTESVPYK